MTARKKKRGGSANNDREIREEIRESAESFARAELIESDADVFSCYANDLLVNHTPWDFQLTFSEFYKKPTGGSRDMTIVPRVRVAISPPHIRAVIEALESNLAKYERKFGPVNKPDIEGAVKRATEKPPS